MGAVSPACSALRTLFFRKPSAACGSERPIDHVGKWVWHSGHKAIHGCDFTSALILNSLQWKCYPVLTETASQGWACLCLSDVSHSLPETHILNTSHHKLGKKPSGEVLVFGRFIFFSSCPWKTNSEICFILPLPFENLFWNSLSFHRLENAHRWSVKRSLLRAMAGWLWPCMKGKINWGSVPVGVMKTS